MTPFSQSNIIGHKKHFICLDELDFLFLAEQMLSVWYLGSNWLPWQDIFIGGSCVTMRQENRQQ